MKLSMIALLIFCLVLGGCTSGQVLVTLETSVAATEALVVSLTVVGNIGPVTAAEITAAIVGLPKAFQQTSAELATTDAAAIKYAKIALYYAPTLESIKLLPPAAQVYASALVAAIQTFLDAIAPAAALSAGKTSKSLQVSQYHDLGNRISLLSSKIAAMQKK